jgi:hypothetical protein
MGSRTASTLTGSQEGIDSSPGLASQEAPVVMVVAAVLVVALAAHRTGVAWSSNWVAWVSLRCSCSSHSPTPRDDRCLNLPLLGRQT